MNWTMRKIGQLVVLVSLLAGCTATKSLEETFRDLTDGISAGGDIRRVSRAFAGPNDLPPNIFKAYGIIVFPDRPDQDRGTIFCRAYVSSLLSRNKLNLRGIPDNQQMITVWPIDEPSVVANLHEQPNICQTAVAHYDLFQSLQALEEIKDVERRTIGHAGSLREKRGPFLLAWSPGDTKGDSNAIVLVSDLSSVNSFEQAQLEFRRWREDIQLEPQFWNSGWDIEMLRITIQRWADGSPSSLAVHKLVGWPE